jgi:hypothetical protein
MVEKWKKQPNSISKPCSILTNDSEGFMLGVLQNNMVGAE